MDKKEALGRGYIAENSNRKNPNAPTHKGKVTVEGKEYEISGWEKTNDSGNVFISISFSEPWVKTAQKPTEVKTPAFDDSETIPF